MNTLEARIECLKLAVQCSPADRSPQTVAQVATTLYDWCKDGESATPPAPSPESRNADSPSFHADKRTRRKAPAS